MKPLKKFLYPLPTLIAFATIFASHPAAASCGTASCPLDLSAHESLDPLQIDPPPALNLQLAFEHIDQDQPHFGTDKIPFGQIRRPDHDEIETQNRNIRLLATYAANARWSFSLSLPVVKRTHSHLSAPGHIHDDDHDHTGKRAAQDDGDRATTGELQSWDFTRIGDLTAQSRYRPWPHLLGGKADLSAGVGIGVPSGPTSVRNGDGDRAEPTLQPGRGAWALLFETAFAYVRPDARSPAGRRPARYFASTFYRLNFRGERDYQFGDEWVFHLGAQYPLWRRLDLLGQFVSRWSGGDEPGRTGDLTDATGGTFVYLSPGLEVDLGRGVSLYGYYQLPIYQEVNQVQITSDRNLLFGLGYRLAIESVL